MPELTTVAVDMEQYRTHQYTALVDEFRALIGAGFDHPAYLNAARIKWGLDYDSAELALREADAA